MAAYISPPRRDQEIIPIPLKRTKNMPPVAKPNGSRRATSTTTTSDHGVRQEQPPPPRRSHSTGEKPYHNNNNNPAALQNQMVDRFGFITNIDSNGKILPSDKMTNDQKNGANGGAAGGNNPEGGVDAEEEAKLMARREKKWSTMMETWDVTNRRRHKLVLTRLRKGLPDSMRGKVWPLLGGVPKKMRDGSSTRGIYKALLKQCEEDNQNALDHMPPEGPNQSKSAGLSMMVRSNSFQNIQETIERDIPRTFPRHCLFYDEDNHKDDLPTNAAGNGQAANNKQPPPTPIKEEDEDSDHGLGGLCIEDMSILMSELDIGGGGGNSSSDKKKKKAAKQQQQQQSTPPPTTAPPIKKSNTCENMLVQAKGGQAALRRVLCAYSYYDREVGYCQGMNFIAAMFITIMTEEEAFWMLVAVMNENPCHMRGLFGKGMSETHKVLHVAEKLIHHFLPKLAKHLDKENVHVTMYATQWLLTQYTSSFNFDLVTRVWDCFLVEGFKSIYRVMLALLQTVQPILLKKSFEEILGFFREMPDQIEAKSVMETAMKIPLKRKHIAKYEAEWQAQQDQK